MLGQVKRCRYAFARELSGLSKGQSILLNLYLAIALILQVQRRKNRALSNLYNDFGKSLLALRIFQRIGAIGCQGRLVLMPLPYYLYSSLPSRLQYFI